MIKFLLEIFFGPLKRDYERKTKELEGAIREASAIRPEFTCVEVFQRTDPALHLVLAEVSEKKEVQWFFEDLERAQTAEVCRDMNAIEYKAAYLAGMRKVREELGMSKQIYDQLTGATVDKA